MRLVSRPENSIGVPRQIWQDAELYRSAVLRRRFWSTPVTPPVFIELAVTTEADSDHLTKSASRRDSPGQLFDAMLLESPPESPQLTR